MQLLQEWQDDHQTLVVRVDIGQDGRWFPEQVEAEGEVGPVNGVRERFEEDVGDDVGI